MTNCWVAIYGAGGFAREVAWLVESCADDNPCFEVACFIDDADSCQEHRLNGIPVVRLAEAGRRFPGAAVVGGIGNPATRQKTLQAAEAAGFAPASFVYPRAQRSRWVEIGPGTVVCAGCILTTNIRLGRHVQINLDCTVGHDVLLDDYATLAPGVHVSGNVHVGRWAGQSEKYVTAPTSRRDLEK